MSDQRDTIAAIATPSGQASIGVIRLSGPGALAAASAIWRGKKLRPRQLTLGWIVEGAQKLDQAMAVYMPAPHSYTGEDVVEIQLHGSSLLCQRVLNLVVAGSARLAEPGEFTKRAYLNGKLDLAQAEAVAELISGEHQALVRLSADQLAGGLSLKVGKLKHKLARLAASLAAQLDFSEEDVADIDYQKLSQALNAISKELVGMLSGGADIVKLREGVKIALIGLPNAGKSTLLNELLGYERAIVTEIAGTTRDIIQEEIMIGGLLFRLVDTAGLNFEPETIEQLGIAKTIAELKSAQIILLLVEPGKMTKTFDYLHDNNLVEILTPQNTLLVQTKSDVKKELSRKQPYDNVAVSVRRPASIEALKKKLASLAIDKHSLENATLSTRRQLDCVQTAADHVENARLACKAHHPYDVILIDLEAALSSLNELTGEQISAQVIDALFANFCIGK